MADEQQQTPQRRFSWSYLFSFLLIVGIIVTVIVLLFGGNKTTTLTNVSEDLMALSMELKIPVLIVVQANRNGATEDENVPELESIRDSDGISHNASKVMSIRQLKDGILKMEIKKQRFGAVGGKLTYSWNINTGEFTYVPADNDAQPVERKERKIKEIKKQANKDIRDVF